MTPKQLYLKPFWRQEFIFFLKALGVYLLYIILVVYSANGQFDSVAFFFSLIAIAAFLEEHPDLSLLFAAVSTTFQYQAGIFLLPLIVVNLTQLLQKNSLVVVLRNKIVLATLGFAALDLVTAGLSIPFLFTIRPELILNGANAFRPHAQIPWAFQTSVVMLTLSVTLISAIYLLNRNRLASFFAVFTLLPAFTMPYFQPWYLPFFFVYVLIPQSKQSLKVTLIWLTFMVFVLSFGGLSYNPLLIFDNIRRILHL